jgi:methionine synthase II (cobalamin-independent)
MRLIRESPKTSEVQYQHNDFIKALIEQQKLAQQQEHEHQQKFQQEQQVRLITTAEAERNNWVVGFVRAFCARLYPAVF